jgi:putative nucleotidyltransferase with HDIG domain
MVKGKDYKILVVDDEDYIRDSIEIILSTEGYEVYSADSGMKALKILEEKDIDVVLSDVKMPEMDGITLLKIIKEKFPVEVLLITGFPSLDTAVESVKLGAYDYITKPFKVDDLLNKIEKAIENKQLKKEVVELQQIVSIYDSSKYFSNLLDIDVIFNKFETILKKQLKNDGYFIKLFTKGVFKHTDLPTELHKFINESCDYKGALMTFYSGQYYKTLFTFNSKDITLLVLPLVSREGLWGIVGVYREGSKGYSDLECKIHSIYTDQFSASLLNYYNFEEISKGYLETVTALSKAVDAKDHYTMNHSENVKEYSVMIAEEMGFNEEFKEMIVYAGLLHDIGKIGIPTEILIKPGKLNEEEFEIMKQHSIYGKEILSPIEFLGDVPYFVLYHHEKLDGSGYPYGLTADEIPLGAKILHVADAYDAMTTDRSYRLKRNHKLAFEELDRCTGTQFDRDIVLAFKSAMKRRNR